MSYFNIVTETDGTDEDTLSGPLLGEEATTPPPADDTQDAGTTADTESGADGRLDAGDFVAVRAMAFPHLITGGSSDSDDTASGSETGDGTAPDDNADPDVDTGTGSGGTDLPPEGDEDPAPVTDGRTYSGPPLPPTGATTETTTGPTTGTDTDSGSVPPVLPDFVVAGDEGAPTGADFGSGLAQMGADAFVFFADAGTDGANDGGLFLAAAGAEGTGGVMIPGLAATDSHGPGADALFLMADDLILM